MEWVEVTGRSLDEAKDRALDQLGVAEEDAEFEILAEPRSGLFGLVRAEARVRARVRPKRPRAREARRERGRRQGRRSPARSRTDDSGGSQASSRDTNGPRRRRRPRRQQGPVEADGSDVGQEELVVSDLSPEEQAALAEEFLEELVDRFELEAQVDTTMGEEDGIDVSVAGADLGLLIGPGGSTLGAIQELTRTVVQRRSGGRTGRVFVDVAGYKEKRRDALSRFARQVAEDVLASREEEVLEPMSASDRKVIHDTVNAIDGVGTRSEGEEPRRWVVVVPGP
jgi:spoIIIJ-associated protein